MVESRLKRLDRNIQKRRINEIYGRKINQCLEKKSKMKTRENRTKWDCKKESIKLRGEKGFR